ncbi:hypothetical protein pb186bvf_008524 [Paramecium bursaria]
MLQTQVIKAQVVRQNVGALRFFALATFVGSSYGVYWYKAQANKLEQLYSQVQSDIEEWKPISIRGRNAKVYPWALPGKINQWEYKLVSLYGYFRDERFFVRRQREGRDGYIVLAPFITSIFNPHFDKSPEKQTNSQVIVNLGWVPIENQSDIKMSQDPLGTTPIEELVDVPEYDGFTEFYKDPQNMEEDQQFPYVQFTGLIRKGEEQNLFRRKVNFMKEGVYNYIDLWLLSRFFRSFNLRESSTAYVERIVQAYDEESENLYPIPATKDNFDKVTTPARYNNYSTFFGVTALTSLVLSLL